MSLYWVRARHARARRAWRAWGVNWPPSPAARACAGTVREQSVSGAAAAADIAQARDSIGDLAEKIREIAHKAEASERMVQDICRDIKQLDVAKKHLTSTIQAVARLQTLSVCVADLTSAADRRAYEEAAPQMEAALQMFTHFAEHRDVPKVSELYTAVKKLSEDLERKISDDFEFLVDCVTPDSLNFDEDARGGIRHITISSAELGAFLSGHASVRRWRIPCAHDGSLVCVRRVCSRQCVAG